jgi:uracil-DNA glycosylase family 4
MKELYWNMQRCKACRLGYLPINLIHPRLEGWGKKGDIVFVPMNPSSRRAVLHKNELNFGIFPTLPIEAKQKSIGKLGMIYVKELKGWVAKNDAPLLLALKYLNIQRENVYITDLVKCCTADNKLDVKRDMDVIEICKNRFLLKELEFLRPKIVIGVGKTFMKAFSLKNFGKISTLKLPNGYKTFLSVIHHPGYFLHRGILGKNREKLLREYVQEIASLLRWAK